MCALKSGVEWGCEIKKLKGRSMWLSKESVIAFERKRGLGEYNI